MHFGFSFFCSSILLGVGLAMDAFSVSLANGLAEPCMKRRKALGVSGIFAGFQFLMPLVGFLCVSTMAEHFSVFAKAIPVIALLLLGFIGGKMLYEGICNKGGCEAPPATLTALLVQGVATSIDALSVGFTIADYHLTEALVACLLIGGVTFLLCYAGILIGRVAGTRLAGKAGILGGTILIAIGLKIFISSLL